MVVGALPQPPHIRFSSPGKGLFHHPARIGSLEFALGVVVLYLGWANVVTGGWGLALKIVGFLPLLTGLVGWCPAYALLKVSTKK